MNLSKVDFWKIIHILTGGGICLATIVFLDPSVQRLLELALKSFNSLGILLFEETQNAVYIIRLGTVYIISGFLGGLYTGYRIKENLKINMIFPSIAGFIFLLILWYFAGYWELLRADLLLKSILIPLSISSIGSYLGGYTLNWHVEEKVKEEKITLLPA